MEATTTSAKFQRDGNGYRARMVSLDSATGQVVAELADLGWFANVALGKRAADAWVAANKAGA